MILASTTITSSRRDLIGDALRSVAGWVDLCVLLDLGIQDDTVEVARSIVGDKLRVVPYSGPSTTADWRNAAMDAAHALGADWAVTLDTDERLHNDCSDLRGILERSEAPLLLAYDNDHVYFKERFFRLPLEVRFRGHCHERTPDIGFHVIPGVTFHELPKSPTAQAQKFEFIIRESQAAIDAGTADAVDWYYLGDALAGLDRFEEALEAFEAFQVRCPGNASGQAWGAFRAALCLDAIGEHREALEACARGLTYHAGASELAWYAAIQALKLHRPDQAVFWARMAVPNGKADGIGGQIKRHFFQNPKGQWEGPYEVLAAAWQLLGGHALATDYAKRARKALKKRAA